MRFAKYLKMRPGHGPGHGGIDPQNTLQVSGQNDYQRNQNVPNPFLTSTVILLWKGTLKQLAIPEKHITALSFSYGLNWIHLTQHKPQYKKP